MNRSGELAPVGRFVSNDGVRVLLLDNYDSFTFNLVQALRVLGADVDVRRNDALSVEEAVGGVPGDAGRPAPPDAIVVSPGPKDPAHAGISVPLVRAAAARGIPLLGVCLGHQSIGEAFGGRTVSAARLLHGKSSAVRHTGHPLFRGVSDPFEAMRYHSLVVAEPLPPELVRIAWTVPPADAGGKVPADELMGVAHVRLPVFGVQFHPESYRTPDGPAILSNFLTLAGGTR